MLFQKEMIHSKIRQTFLIVIFVITVVATVFGQSSLEQSCKNVDILILQVLKPIKIYRQDIYKADCQYEFDITNNEDIYISIEKYKNDKEARKALKSDLRSFLAYNNLEETPKFNKLKLESSKKWNKVFFYSSKFRDNFMLLQDGNFTITLISSSSEVLVDLEKRLRDIKFTENGNQSKKLMK